jgi:hypothetical protein
MSLNSGLDQNLRARAQKRGQRIKPGLSTGKFNNVRLVHGGASFLVRIGFLQKQSKQMHRQHLNHADTRFSLQRRYLECQAP